MEELVECMGEGMKLTEGERRGITITEVDVSELRARSELCLLGRLMSERRVQKEALRALMTRLWKTLEGVAFTELHDNLWLLEFSNLADKRRIKEGRSWLFDRSLLVLKELDDNVPSLQMDFSSALFWIQVHDMPLTCMNREVELRIGQSIGLVEDVDVTSDGVGWGRYLRIRVNVDITKPLEKGRPFLIKGKSIWVSFKYEKLPLFCYHCGRIYHADKTCSSKTGYILNDDTKARPWGSWLRAEDMRSKKEVAMSAQAIETRLRKKLNGIQDAGTMVNQAESGFPAMFTSSPSQICTNNILLDGQSCKENDEVQSLGQRAGNGPVDKLRVDLVEDSRVRGMVDAMESDEKENGTSSIKWQDLKRDWCEKKSAVCRDDEQHQRDGQKQMVGIPNISFLVTVDNLGKKNEVGCMDLSTADSSGKVSDQEAKYQRAHMGGPECVEDQEVSIKNVDKNMTGPHRFGPKESSKEAQVCGPDFMNSDGNKPISGSEPMCEAPLDCVRVVEASTDVNKKNMDQENGKKEKTADGPLKMQRETPMQADSHAVGEETRKGRVTQKTWTCRVRNPTVSQSLMKGGK